MLKQAHAAPRAVVIAGLIPICFLQPGVVGFSLIEVRQLDGTSCDPLRFIAGDGLDTTVSIGNLKLHKESQPIPKHVMMSSMPNIAAIPSIARHRLLSITSQAHQVGDIVGLVSFLALPERPPVYRPGFGTQSVWCPVARSSPAGSGAAAAHQGRLDW